MAGSGSRDWSEGYVSDVDYTRDYYRELNPHVSDLTLLHAGFAPAGRETGACCELGFGFGLSANIHAAASDSEWWGTDFNPAQARFARDLARSSGSGARLFDQSFAEFCARTDLPEFDFVGLHGIWSWVSDENRRRIVDFVRRRLRVGGLLYVCYNAQPGWAQMVPLRRLILEHAESLTAPGTGAVARIEAAVDFANALLAASPGYAALHPTAASRVRALKEQDKNYLAHEYFNRDWHPMLFSEFSSALEPAKVEFACSALPADHFERFNLQPEQVEFLKRIPDAKFRQSSRDVMINRQLRKDYWIKGPRRLSPAERAAALRAQRVVLVAPPAEIVLKAGGALVEQDLPREIYAPVVELLSDLRPHSLGELEGRAGGRGVSFDALLEAVMILIGKGDAAPVRDEATVERARGGVERFNRHAIEDSAGSATVRFLASPLTGGGVSVQPFHLQMLHARQLGLEGPARWAEYLRKSLAEKGAGLIKPQGGLMSAAESLEALGQESTAFAAKRLPVLQALSVVT